VGEVTRGVTSKKSINIPTPKKIGSITNYSPKKDLQKSL
jgi:hypothetical protein